MYRVLETQLVPMKYKNFFIENVTSGLNFL